MNMCAVQANWLKMYSGYINNYDNAMRILTRLKDKSAWMTFENATRLHPDCRMLRLEDFLIQAHSLPPPPQHTTRHGAKLMNLSTADPARAALRASAARRHHVNTPGACVAVRRSPA